jgi:hypothetical protein
VAGEAQRIPDLPPDQLSWFDLNRLAERDPNELAPIWQGIKAATRDELRSGHRTGDSLERQGGPWQRARFPALRDSFRQSTPPRSGIEAPLIYSRA